MRILYVEDNEVNRALVERVVRARKFSVVFHDEGEEALNTLEKDPTIDLILMDIELAGAISGLDVIRTLRERKDKRPVVAVTAYAMMGDRERILEAGCDQYLPKPLVITDLLSLLDHYQEELTAKAAALVSGTTAAAPAAPVSGAATPVVVPIPAVTPPAPAVPVIPIEASAGAAEPPAPVVVAAAADSPAPAVSTPPADSPSEAAASSPAASAPAALSPAAEVSQPGKES